MITLVDSSQVERGKFETIDEAFDSIRDYISEKGFKSYYYRANKMENNTLEIDYGSHSHFFYLVENDPLQDIWDNYILEYANKDTEVVSLSKQKVVARVEIPNVKGKAIVMANGNVYVIPAMGYYRNQEIALDLSSAIMFPSLLYAMATLYDGDFASAVEFIKENF